MKSGGVDEVVTEVFDSGVDGVTTIEEKTDKPRANASASAGDAHYLSIRQHVLLPGCVRVWRYLAAFWNVYKGFYFSSHSKPFSRISFSKPQMVRSANNLIHDFMNRNFWFGHKSLITAFCLER